jgi:hypothetical protein
VEDFRRPNKKNAEQTLSSAKQKKRRTNAKFRWREVGQRKLYDIFGGHWLAGEHNTVFLAAKKTVEHNVSFGGHSQNHQN